MVSVTDLSKARQIFWRGHQYAIGPYHGFNKDGSYVAFIFDNVLEIASAGNIASRILVFDWAVVAVNFWRKYHPLVGRGRFSGPPAGIAGQRDGGHGGSMIRPIPGEDL
jgi:hypothetical protein